MCLGNVSNPLLCSLFMFVPLFLLLFLHWSSDNLLSLNPSDTCIFEQTCQLPWAILLFRAAFHGHLPGPSVSWCVFSWSSRSVLCHLPSLFYLECWAVLVDGCYSQSCLWLSQLQPGLNCLRTATCYHCWPFQYVYQEVVPDVLQKLPGLLVPCCVVLAVDVREVNISCKKQGFWFRDIFELLSWFERRLHLIPCPNQVALQHTLNTISFLLVSLLILSCKLSEASLRPLSLWCYW